MARRDCGIKPAGSDRRSNVIFTCFCKFYLFVFPIIREGTLVMCHYGIFIELESVPKEHSARVRNSASVPNLDDASGH